MSGPYDYNNQGYGAPPAPQYGGGQQQGYNQYPQQNQQYSQQGYSGYPPQQGYDQSGYNNQGGYGSAPYGQQQGYGAPPAPQYGSGGYDQNQSTYGGPPNAGGFNHGQANPQYGQHLSGQQQQYFSQHPPTTNDPSNPYGYTQDPRDPNNPQEGERGFMGAVAGGIGGSLLGHKAGHGVIGALAGAFLGSKGQDYLKKNKHSSHGSHGGSHSGKW
ncbi:hypothetical protein CBER1_09645 [Cercospora berteroae]|uniref:Glycine zipper 2TM domain-containing protein n=1 Tax=Cercospora berteroae TaxID=357750 RepID=A0A2S6BX26_9PEZI|nr:hypothetical protein CBER1_09645 [Cercospora berteroae]